MGGVTRYGLRLLPVQVMKCGWMDWSTADYTDSLDLKSLEDLFGMQETKPKQELPGAHLVVL